MMRLICENVIKNASGGQKLPDYQLVHSDILSGKKNSLKKEVFGNKCLAKDKQIRQALQDY